jgi:hypothetical protein
MTTLPPPDRCDKAVVLFGGDPGHGLEPVGKMRASFFHGPLLHGLGNFVGDGDVQRGAVRHALFPRVIGSGRQPLLHGVLVENHASEQLGEFCGCVHKSSSFIEF